MAAAAPGERRAVQLRGHRQRAALKDQASALLILAVLTRAREAGADPPTPRSADRPAQSAWARSRSSSLSIVPIHGHASGKGRIQHREFAMAAGELGVVAFTSFLTRSCALIAKYSVSFGVQLWL